jgi:hypothetical protein
LSLLLACSARPTTARSTPPPTHVVVATIAPPSIDAGFSSQFDITPNDCENPAQVIETLATDAQTEPVQPNIMDEMRIWVVIGRSCEYIEFLGYHTQHSGSAFIHGYRFGYGVQGNQLTLDGISGTSGGNGSWSMPLCLVKLEVGPDFCTLGGADVFPTKSACEERMATAIPLDDSEMVTVKRCRGIPVPVVNETLECGGPVGYALRWEGCITFIRSRGPRWQRDN